MSHASHAHNDVSIATQKAPTYAFLSQPPPPKKRPSNVLPSPPTPQPSRARSNTFATITSWASLVQPGSPAPCSPRRRPSISGRRPGRRSSITSIRVPSASFLSFIDTPTSGRRTTPSESAKDFQPDLMALGYTSAFVHLPRGPVSATLPVQKSVSTASQDTTLPPTKQPAPKRTRSFSVLKPLRTRARSKSTAMASPPSPNPKSKSKAAIANRKKAKYAHLRPVPLANELALAQFMDGGNMETNIHRFNESHAKAAACSGQSMGVGDVYRDGKGGIWLDQDEEWEYAGLLGGDDEVEEQWVEFGGNMSPTVERRASVSTQDSDLDPRSIIHPVEEHDDLAAFGGALTPRKPNLSVLTTPGRSRRNTLHIHKSGLLFDGTLQQKPKGKDRRRRPAPLTLTPPSPSTRRPSNSPLDTNKVRRDFLDGSFEPEPVLRSTLVSSIHAMKRSSVVMPNHTSARKGMAKKASRSKLNMRGILKSVGGAKRDVK